MISRGYLVRNEYNSHYKGGLGTPATCYTINEKSYIIATSNKYGNASGISHLLSTVVNDTRLPNLKVIESIIIRIQ